MNDEGFRLSDEYLNELEKRIAKLYSKASKKAVKKVKKYLEQFDEEDTEKRQEYESGEISKDEYSKWRRNLMIVGAFYVLRNELTNDLTDVDVKAMQFAASTMLDVYALNVNYEMYCIEHDLMVDLGYSLYNRKAVERLINENPKLLPRPKVNIPKDMKWNRTHIQTAITQGIIQGDSIPDIAKRLERVVGMDKNAAIRNARTAMTGAQNAGRLESMKEAQSKGVGIKKVWIAVLDNVTRSSHRHLDGETVDLDKPFSNGLMFPADPNGEPSEVYNCRCGLARQYDRYKTDWLNLENRRHDKLGNMTYEEWQEAKPIRRKKDGKNN